MTSFRQIQANRRNAQHSTGPVTEEGKGTSRQNAVRHGLTAETVIDALEDAEDYAAFEMAITADYDAQSAVERELVLRLASMLWRLRRATAIESGLFKIQARQLLQCRQQRKAYQKRPNVVDGMYRDTVGTEDETRQNEIDRAGGVDIGLQSTTVPADQFDKVTRSFVHLSNLPTYPLDRLSRYEATLWRQACQVLFTLRYLNPRKPWDPILVSFTHHPFQTLTSAKRSTNQNAAHLVMKLRYDHCHARQLCRADREKVWDCSLGRFFGSGRHVPQHCARPTPCCAKEALGGVARDYVSGSSPLESHDVVRPAATLGFYR